VENSRQLPQHELITLGLLHGDGFVEQLPLAEILEDKIQQVDVLHTHPWCDSGDMFQQEADMFTDAQLGFRGVVEDVKGYLVPKAGAMQKGLRGDSGENLIEAIGQGIRHDPTWMQRST
jgi:hypothetical protein